MCYPSVTLTVVWERCVASSVFLSLLCPPFTSSVYMEKRKKLKGATEDQLTIRQQGRRVKKERSPGFVITLPAYHQMKWSSNKISIRLLHQFFPTPLVSVTSLIILSLWFDLCLYCLSSGMSPCEFSSLDRQTFLARQTDNHFGKYPEYGFVYPLVGRDCAGNLGYTSIPCAFGWGGNGLWDEMRTAVRKHLWKTISGNRRY